MINTRVLTTPPTKYERRTGTNYLSSHNFRKGVGGVKGGDSRG